MSGVQTTANRSSAMMARDLQSRPTFSAFLPRSQNVALPFEFERVELAPSTAIGGSNRQQIKIPLPKYGLLYSLELQVTLQITAGASETSGTPTDIKFPEGIFANIVDRVELMNSAGVKMGTLHGESFGFFDIMTNKLPPSEKEQLCHLHNYTLPENRVDDIAQAVDADSAKMLPKVFRCKLPFWCLDNPSTCLPMAYLSGETYVVITFNDLNLCGIDNSGFTGVVTTTGSSLTFPSSVSASSVTDRKVQFVQNGLQSDDTLNNSNHAVCLQATYVRLPDAHMQIYQAAVMSGPVEYPSATQEKQVIRLNLKKKTYTSHDRAVAFKLDSLPGLCTEIMFALYQTKHRRAGSGTTTNDWMRNCVKLTNIELRGSGKSLFGKPITHEELKHFVQPQQYGYSHSKHDEYLRATSNTGNTTADVIAAKADAQHQRLISQLQQARVEENVYIYSFSLSPSRPELNHGAVSITELHGFELLVDIPDAGITEGVETPFELLVLTNNRGIIRTDVLSNSLLGLQELKEL